MAKEKETVKIKLTGNSDKPWEVLRRSPEGDYNNQGSKYTIKGLVNYLINATAEFIFESPQARQRYEEEVRRYEEAQKAKKTAWEKEQDDKVNRQGDSKLELKLAMHNLQAESLLRDMRADHEPKED